MMAKAKREGRFAKEGRNAASATAVRRHQESADFDRSRKMRLLLSVVLVVGLSSAAGGLGYYYREEILHPGQSSEPPEHASSACVDPTMPANGNPVACLDTSMGAIALELFADKAPTTVEHFEKLADRGFFDGLTFHRVIEDFMIQGGDPKGDGSGGSGDPIADEFTPLLRHDRAGTLSMANSGPNTGDSQFFITVEATPHLDAYDSSNTLKACGQPGVSCHAVFGRTLDQKSLDVVIAINKVPTDSNKKPLSPVTMRTVTILR